MKIETSATETREVLEIRDTAKMQSEIVDIICDSDESFSEVVAVFQDDEDIEDYANNSGVMEVWGVRHFGANEHEYRAHIMTEATRKKNLGL